MAATYTNRAMTQYSGDTAAALFLSPNVIDWTKKTKRTDTPLLKLIGRGKANTPAAIKDEWGWSSPDPDSDQLNGALDISQTNVTVDDASKFQVGSVFRIESEGFLATGINETTNVVTVATRPYYGSAATHADNMSIMIQAPAIAENQATPLSTMTQGEKDYNYFQQIEESIQLSHRAQVIGTQETLSLKLGAREQAELRKKMEDSIPTLLENSLLFGGRTLGTAAGSPSSMGGLLTTSTFITTQNTSLSGVLTEGNLMSNLQTVHNLVGDKIGRKVMAHPFVCEVISSWYNDTRRTSGMDESIKTFFTKIDTGWFGEFTLYPNYKMLKSAANGHVPLDQLVVFNDEDLSLIPLSGDSGWSTAALPEEGWYSRMAIRGDFTLRAQQPDTRLLLGGFSTTRSDYAALA